MWYHDMQYNTAPCWQVLFSGTKSPAKCPSVKPATRHLSKDKETSQNKTRQCGVVILRTLQLSPKSPGASSDQAAPSPRQRSPQHRKSQGTVIRPKPSQHNRDTRPHPQRHRTSSLIGCPPEHPSYLLSVNYYSALQNYCYQAIHNSTFELL